MKNIPRLLPLIGVAMVGVLGLNALAGAESLPDLVSGARAFAEEAAKGATPAKDAKAATGEAKDAAATVPNLPPAAKPAAVCAPTAAELAKEAGLSPAELQVLQSLGARRGQLDKREQDLDVQLALMAAAEAKLDAKIQALNGMKGDIAKLMVDADAKEQAEIDRLVKVFELMKPKDAAPRMVLLDDAVRLPVASRMKERALSPIIANMPPAEAKKLTEALAARFAEVKKVAAAAQAAAGPLPAAPRAAGQAAAPAPKAAAPPAKAG
ncbi:MULTISPECIES: MotE family protein [unclassified Phenylobacterium]|uniref:MotE family protein n=1 Tax=unclassified Phenylobacterium TaxID=2640670 RepID=UPI0022B4CE8A|nr:MotE family protein [Phenylobacterium sp. NIBR 498073]WGU39350.1 MotE family protein [Phenylobacterium sp. NIBR 498073]